MSRQKFIAINAIVIEEHDAKLQNCVPTHQVSVAL